MKNIKKEILKKGLPILLSITTCISVLNGCKSKKDDNKYIYETVYEEDSKYECVENEQKAIHQFIEFENEIDLEILKSIETVDKYYIIMLDEEIYLAKKNIIQKDEDIITEFYDVKTGEFIGQISETSTYTRALEEAKTAKRKADLGAGLFIECTTPEVEFQNSSHKYYNGEYGYGKNLPFAAITSLSDVYEEETLEEKDIEFFSSNTKELKDFLENKIIYSTLKVKTQDNYKFIYLWNNDYYNASDKEPSYYYQDTYYHYYRPIQITYIGKDEQSSKIIGFRLDYKENSDNYNIIYDILTHKLYDINEIKKNNPKTNIKIASGIPSKKEFLTYDSLSEPYINYNYKYANKTDHLVQEIVKDGIKYLVDATDYTKIILEDYDIIGDCYILEYYEINGVEYPKLYAQEIIKDGIKTLISLNNTNDIILYDYDSISEEIYYVLYNKASGGVDEGHRSGCVREIVKDGVKYLVDSNDFNKILIYGYDEIKERYNSFYVSFSDGTCNVINNTMFCPYEDDILTRTLQK